MATSLENPWLQLPKQPPYVLPDDGEQIRAFNARAKPQLQVHLELIPEPFLGNPTAPVVLLNLNPGYSPSDVRHHENPVFAKRSRDNLLHQDSKYPFYLLDPEITAPGHHWWNRRLRALIERVGRETVAQRVLCVEYFPYHSTNFGHQRLDLTSQQYSFSLVRHAVSRNAIVVIMRGRRLWLDAVPELNEFRHLRELRNFQSPYVSPRNCPDSFESILTALTNS